MAVVGASLRYRRRSPRPECGNRVGWSVTRMRPFAPTEQARGTLDAGQDGPDRSGAGGHGLQSRTGQEARACLLRPSRERGEGRRTPPRHRHSAASPDVPPVGSPRVDRRPADPQRHLQPRAEARGLSSSSPSRRTTFDPGSPLAAGICAVGTHNAPSPQPSRGAASFIRSVPCLRHPVRAPEPAGRGCCLVMRPWLPRCRR